MQHDKIKKKVFKVGMVVPGWPLKNYPNGIVTYVNNLSYGFNKSIELTVLAASLNGAELKDKLVNLSTSFEKKNIFQKIIKKIISRIKFRNKENNQFENFIWNNANGLELALKELTSPLDILELEESFGTATFLNSIDKTLLITRLHGPWFVHGPIMKMDSDSDYLLRVFYEGEGIKKSHGVTSPSLDVLEKTRQYYGLELSDAKVIPNPVLEVSIEERWKHNSEIKPYILVVGRFDLHKGGDLALKAFQLIASKNNEVELLFVGPDRGITIDNVNIGFNEYVEQFIADNDVKKRIKFLGHCDQNHISALRKNALITAVCSRYENFPMSLLEALATGCPTVATAVGGMKEIIIDDFNGLLAEPESAKSIAEKVLLLINDPEKCQRLSKNAIEDCKKRFSPEIVAAQTVEYYQSVLDRLANTTVKN